MAVATTLRELRRQHNTTQESLADAINSHQVYISEIERGKKIPSLVTLQKIADCYGLSLTALVQSVEAKLNTGD